MKHLLCQRLNSRHVFVSSCPLVLAVQSPLRLRLVAIAHNMIQALIAPFPLPCPEETADCRALPSPVLDQSPIAVSNSACHSSGPVDPERSPSPQAKEYFTNPRGSSKNREISACVFSSGVFPLIATVILCLSLFAHVVAAPSLLYQPS